GEVWEMAQSASDNLTNAPMGAPEFGSEEGKAVENYSTVKSAQRLSATLSIRLKGRLEIIDK
ncbi:MAG: hypothetical protein WBW78_08855, partial [Terrimicrobiaceae bacterium]